MLTEQQLRGIFVPAVTPFDLNEQIDQESLLNHLHHLLNSEIHGLVMNGTTGESPTISEDDFKLLLKAARHAIGSTVKPLVMGTGTNDTRTTVSRTELAGNLGADAALVVVPYYSKPSQRGIIEHFRHAAQVGIPIIVYEIPHRTGVSLTLETLRTILELEGVIGLKDSTETVQLVSELSHCQSKPILCGNDINFYASLCSGAKGGMLASANVETKRFVRVYNKFLSGQLSESKFMFDELVPLIELLFAEPNPAPLKWLLAQQGLIAADMLRLPMIRVSSELQQKLEFFNRSSSHSTEPQVVHGKPTYLE